MWNKILDFFKPKPKPVKTFDVGAIKLTIELDDGSTSTVLLEGYFVGDYYMEVSHLLESSLKRIAKEGVIVNDEVKGKECYLPHRISKIMIGQRQSLIKEFL